MLEALGVIALFMARIGIPLVALVVLGVIVGRWQERRDAEIQRMYGPPPLHIYRPEDEEERDESQQKAA